MEFKIAATIIFISAITGSFLAFSGSEVDTSGDVHKHAKFAVVTNGSDVEMTSKKFQLNSEDVHLEANRSHIVHKHADGVTWNRFIETLPVEIRDSNASKLCVKVVEDESCGSGSIILNEDTSPDLDSEISQGDKLLVVVSTDRWEEISEDFMDSELPDAYRPFWLNGREV